MKKITQHLFDNFGLKIFSFIVAVGVWFFVVIANKPELNFVVPLEFENIPENMELMGEGDYELEVKVKGKQSLLSTLSARQIEAVLDLTNTKAGEHVHYIFPEQINLPAGLKASRVVPNKVKFKLETFMERLLPVEPVIVGIPAEGYEIKEVVVFPKDVRVVGAQSLVESLKSVRTASLNITGFDTSVSKKLELLPLPDKLEFSNGSTVEVRAIIGEKSEEKEFTVPIQFSPVRWKAVVEPVDVKIKAKGPISRIRALKATEIIAVIDLIELKPEQVDLEVKVQLPADIELISKEPAKVKVISIEKPPQDEMLRPTIGGGIPPANQQLERKD